MRHFASFGLAAIVLAFAPVAVVKADAIPYGNPGFENATTYTFTAAATANVKAYFAGSQAGFTNDLGLLVNGVDTGIYGLNNQTSAVGLSLDFGSVTAGDTLTFVMRNLIPGLGNLYSNPALNGPYDGGGIHNHIYSTAYTATSPIIGSIPAGTYVAFEDLPANFPPDWNYHDETFVFTNVATSVAPLPSTAWVGLALFAGLGIFQLSRRSTATA